MSGMYNHKGSPMYGWTVRRRETGLIEAFCEHDVGHPIPESIAWMDEHGLEGARGTWGIHGCCSDMCCRVR